LALIKATGGCGGAGDSGTAGGGIAAASAAFSSSFTSTPVITRLRLDIHNHQKQLTQCFDVLSLRKLFLQRRDVGLQTVWLNAKNQGSFCVTDVAVTWLYIMPLSAMGLGLIGYEPRYVP
jgi:hypothetical protein